MIWPLILATPGKHAEHAAHAAELLHLLQLIGKVFEVERPLLHLLGDLRRFLDVDRLRGFLDKRDNVAHAENAGSNTLGVEILERVPFLADADQLDRLAGDGAHRERSTAAAIAIGTRQHDAGDADVAVEGFGGVDGVLARQRVGNK